MRAFATLFFSIVSILVFQSCNTLYNFKSINLEVVEPGQVLLPKTNNNVVLKYNNANISYNDFFSNYQFDESFYPDTANTDSVASFLFFETFKNNLSQNSLFNNIIEWPETKFTNTQFNDSMVSLPKPSPDSIKSAETAFSSLSVATLAKMLQTFKKVSHRENAQLIDPKYGLMKQKELDLIADSTNADLLISLDFFATIDGINFSFRHLQGMEAVHIYSYWSLYDLQSLEMMFFERLDTVSWMQAARNIEEAKKYLPPRKDAVLNAAEITGNNFANFLAPHWIEVQRIYYQSGQLDFKPIDKLIEDGKWMQAAEIWKKNVNNPNKKIAAKSMFNMGLVCEIEGDLDAALDWVVRSYHVFGEKNEVNAFHCMDYIRILAQRKLDIKKIDSQLNSNVLDMK